MRRFWQSTAMLMLALLVPTSVHCLIDAEMSASCAAVQMHHHHEHDEPAPDHDDHGAHNDPCDTFAKTNLPASVAVPPMPVAMLAHDAELLLQIAARELVYFDVLSAPPTVAPDELRSCWVFTTRAALPARCPTELA